MRTIVFTSGKGGVGKSTVAVNVAVALARSGTRVGLLDADVYGPDIPVMLGMTRRTPTSSVTLWQADQPLMEPVDYRGVAMMSPQLLVSEDQPLDWESPLVGLLLRQLVHGVAWGELDIVIVDVPPGTGDLQQQVFGLLPGASAVLVVTPQYAAHLDARKLLAMLRRRGVPVLGGVENMSRLSCPDCGHELRLFARAADEHTIWVRGVERLADIPFAAMDGARSDRTPIVLADPRSATGVALTALARILRERADG